MTTYEKYINNDFQNSTFWKSNISDDIDNDDYAFKMNALVKYKNAIGNFVHILTKQNIPVKYEIKGMSGYTDGHVVTLSSNINKKNFDSTVGLALHEGSHIVLSDFDVIKDLCNVINESKRTIKIEEVSNILETIYASKTKTDIKPIITLILTITNYIEDRRIDKYIQDTCPGYIGYYESLYFRYFNNPIVSDMLKSDEYRDETIDSYMVRILNFTNSDTDLKALKHLENIYNLIDINNIDRLKNTTDSLKVSHDILKILLKNIKDLNTFSKSSTKYNTKINEIELDEDDIERMFNDPDQNDTSDDSIPVKVKLTPKALKKFNELFNKQKKFIQGKSEKKGLSEHEVDKIDKMSEQNYTMHNVHDHLDTCLVTDNITIEKFYMDSFPYSDPYKNKRNQVPVDEGIRLGNILKNKLKIRNEENVVQFFNKEFGRINKRQLYSASFNKTFFKQSITEKYGKCILHICIDMSDSMYGQKLEQVITCTTAIAKAIEYIENIDLQISLRSSTLVDNILSVVYDTTKGDKFKKILTMFPDLTENGGTPEGLCFEALLNYLTTGNNETQSVFINFSDGEPTYRDGIEHTRRMVKKIEEKGIEVLSYFIHSEYRSSINNFNRMYGKSAYDIDVKNIANIAKTINEKLLLK